MESIRGIIAKFYGALNLQGDEKLLKEVLAEDWTVNPALSGEGSDADKYLKAVKPIFSALPDFKINILQTVVEGNFVAVRGEVTATHAGSLFGVPATNKTIAYMTQDFHQFKDGKIAASWHIEDWLSVLFQIGAIKL